jgi:hypothetical protein
VGARIPHRQQLTAPGADVTNPTIATEPCCKQCTRDNRNRYADRARFHANQAAGYYRRTLWCLGIVSVLAAASIMLTFFT